MEDLMGSILSCRSITIWCPGEYLWHVREWLKIDLSAPVYCNVDNSGALRHRQISWIRLRLLVSSINCLLVLVLLTVKKKKEKYRILPPLSFRNTKLTNPPSVFISRCTLLVSGTYLVLQIIDSAARLILSVVVQDCVGVRPAKGSLYL